MYARHKDFRLFTVMFLVLLAVTSLIGCTGNEPNAPEEPAPIPQVEEPEPEIQASNYVFSPTSFEDLPEIEGEVCPEFSNPAQQVKMVGVGESNAGGALIVFETGFPISMARTQTTLRANGADLPFDCEQVPNSENRFYCWGAPLSPGTESKITLDVQFVEYDPFDLVVFAPTLAERLALPEGQGLEEAWQTFYNCRLDPHAPGCDLLAETVFPPEFDPYGEESPGLVYIWDLEVGFPDLQNVPVFPGRNWDELAESMPENCVLDLRPLANQCGPWLFNPIQIDEITSLEDIMYLIEYLAQDSFIPDYYYQIFVEGNYNRASGEMNNPPTPPMDPNNWTYEELAGHIDREIGDLVEQEGFAACLDLFIRGQTCAESLESWDLAEEIEEVNCATEESVERINQCIEADGAGFIPLVEVGDMEAWVNAVLFAEGYLGYGIDWDDSSLEALLILFWEAFTCEGTEEFCDWAWEEIYGYDCVELEDVLCIEDYLDALQRQAALSMTSSVLPECDPEFPESLWCQGPPEDDSANQLVQGCAEEVDWTGELQTYAQQAQLLRSVALGLPWVSDLREFPECNRLYALNNLVIGDKAGIPLQTPAVCRSMQGDTSTQTVTANFMIPYLGGQQAGDDGDDGGSPALACNSCMDATACVAADGTPNPSATEICTRCICP